MSLAILNLIIKILLKKNLPARALKRKSLEESIYKLINFRSFDNHL